MPSFAHFSETLQSIFATHFWPVSATSLDQIFNLKKHRSSTLIRLCWRESARDEEEEERREKDDDDFDDDESAFFTNSSRFR